MRVPKIYLALSLSVALASPVVAASNTFDGTWWLKSSEDERSGFLSGLHDCLTYGPQSKGSFPDVWQNYPKRVTSYYVDGDKSKSVMSVFEGFAAPHRRKSRASENPYGDVFWRSHRDAARSGFVEGFINCKSATRSNIHWSKPTSYYLNRLNQLYNADDRLGENAKEYAGSIDSAMEQNADK